MKKVKCHNVKIECIYFERVINGTKLFEIRFDDRDYKEGDFIVLHEINGREEITGKTVIKRIGFITGYEQQEGYVVFSLLDLTTYIGE